MKHRRRKATHHLRSLVLLFISAILILAGAASLWVATLRMPDLASFNSRQIIESTKFYDRTGKILLYDSGINVRRTDVSIDDVSTYIQKATVAIEDANFYNNIGIEPTSIIRAVIANLVSGGYGQGASTITQQVVKNTLLTQDKTITRKIKEWVLAIKLTKIMPKNKILETYLNETSYGGTIYGVEEASRSFFGKTSMDVTLAEAAYLAAIPQAPSRFSPYGTHKSELDARQKLVLQRMKSVGFITDAEFKKASAEKVQFLAKNDGSIRAPHFVMMVKDYLTQKYGEERVSSGGLRVITTLDYDMQQKAESVIKKFSPTLASNFNASNTAMVAIDPKTGDILAMVGSKDYFDASIAGNYNVALALRQPGSTFKPFVYATAFKKGYTPETMLFDVRTEFSTKCTVEGKPKNPNDDPTKVCYSPNEYDEIFDGPMPMRKALAQSRNIPAVKTLYLAGIANAINTARDMGITTLTDPNRYGLTLVLGGGEVRLLDITSAYGVFANDGVRNPVREVLRIEDTKGNVIEEATVSPFQALQPEIARQISSILSDNSVRMNSLKPIADGVGRQVAIKTGTTNDYRDVWTIGYTPNLVVGAWAGNSDNVPMQHNVAGLIISPLWGAFMSQAVKSLPVENFKSPPEPLLDGKPVLRGIWSGGQYYRVDKISGKVATDLTPIETQKDVISNGVHTILQWLNKDDPRGPAPADPKSDSQYEYWEYGVRQWFDNWQKLHPEFKEATSFTIPTQTDDVHLAGKGPVVSIFSPVSGTVIDPQKLLNLQIKIADGRSIIKTEVYINNKYILTSTTDPLNISFIPSDLTDLDTENTLSITVYDQAYNKGLASINFKSQ